VFDAMAQVEDHFGALAPLFTAGKTGDAFVAYQDVLRALAAQLGSSAPPAGKPAAGKPGGAGAPTAAARPGAASDTGPALPARPHRAPVARGTTGLAIATARPTPPAPRWGRSMPGWPTSRSVTISPTCSACRSVPLIGWVRATSRQRSPAGTARSRPRSMPICSRGFRSIADRARSRSTDLDRMAASQARPVRPPICCRR